MICEFCADDGAEEVLTNDGQDTVQLCPVCQWLFAETNLSPGNINKCKLHRGTVKMEAAVLHKFMAHAIRHIQEMKQDIKDIKTEMGI